VCYLSAISNVRGTRGPLATRGFGIGAWGKSMLICIAKRPLSFLHGRGTVTTGILTPRLLLVDWVPSSLFMGDNLST